MLQVAPAGPSDRPTPYLNSAAVQDGFVVSTNLKSMWASDLDRSKLNIKANDLVVCEGGDVGRNALITADAEVIFQNSVHRVRPRAGNDIRYAKYLLEALRSSGYLEVLCNKATIRHFTADKLANLEVPFPSFAYQHAVCNFLDYEAAQIDVLIAKQQRLIELLAEKRQAIITQAVTKGLAPSAPTRPSGIPALGDVPAHWSLGRIKDSVDAALNGTWGSEPGENDLDVWCVRVADFERKSQLVGRTKMTFRSVSKDDLARRRVRRGDLLLEKSGGGEKSPVGFVVEYDHDDIAVCSNFVAVVRMSTGMDPKFWKYVHASNYSHRITERSIKQSTGIQNLDQASYFNEPVGVPPAAEQAEISDYLEGKCAVIDSASDTAGQVILLLKERRSALISAAVTGKIDVREGAA